MSGYDTINQWSVQGVSLPFVQSRLRHSPADLCDPAQEQTGIDYGWHNTVSDRRVIFKVLSYKFQPLICYIFRSKLSSNLSPCEIMGRSEVSLFHFSKRENAEKFWVKQSKVLTSIFYVFHRGKSAILFSVYSVCLCAKFVWVLWNAASLCLKKQRPFPNSSHF